MTTQHKPGGFRAVMESSNKKDTKEDFPTPPWATRALMEHVIKGVGPGPGFSVLEPAAGRGLMSDVLGEYFSSVRTQDLFDYGLPGCKIEDYVGKGYCVEPNSVDWMITNPPFKLAERFVQRGLDEAGRGVAVLCRSNWKEGIGRYQRLFSSRPPTFIATFVERVSMVKGRWDPKARTATSYSWFVWDKHQANQPAVDVWIPPCRETLTRKSDDLFLARFESLADAA